MPLTEKEKKELEDLEKPDSGVEYLTMGVGGAFANMFKTSFSALKRKERVLKLRTKMRMEELGLDPKKDWQENIRIMNEEEERFDQRFKKK